jgi:hypothetical protein
MEANWYFVEWNDWTLEITTPNISLNRRSKAAIAFVVGLAVVCLIPTQAAEAKSILHMMADAIKSGITQ